MSGGAYYYSLSTSSTTADTTVYYGTASSSGGGNNWGSMKIVYEAEPYRHSHEWSCAYCKALNPHERQVRSYRPKETVSNCVCCGAPRD